MKLLLLMMYLSALNVSKDLTSKTLTVNLWADHHKVTIICEDAIVSVDNEIIACKCGRKPILITQDQSIINSYCKECLNQAMHKEEDDDKEIYSSRIESYN